MGPWLLQPYTFGTGLGLGAGALQLVRCDCPCHLLGGGGRCLGSRCRLCGGLRLSWLWAAWWLDLYGPGIGVHGTRSGQLDELNKSQQKN
jgi:hypothetical protein